MTRLLLSRSRVVLLAATILGGGLVPLPAQDLTVIDVSSNGLDGEFAPADDVEINLERAGAFDWDETDRPGGDGVYDMRKWAIVFHYTSVTIPAGVTVTFRNHPSGAPVVWLVDGEVRIDGTLDLRGQFGEIGSLRVPARPGPGGFAGGCGSNIPPLLRSGGLGPGGGSLVPGVPRAGSFGTTPSNVPGETYGNPSILPLIGGSGGASNASAGQQGGGGGGAIFIASRTLIHVDGTIDASGGGSIGFSGSNGGSGGAVRLLAPFVRGDGSVLARGGSSNQAGGSGRIRVEALDGVDVIRQGTPHYTFQFTSDPPLLWAPEDTPAVRVSKVLAGGDEFPVSDDPRARLDFPNADVNVPDGVALTLEIVGTNLPAASLVRARIVPKNGEDFFVSATPVDGMADTWHATYTPPPGVCAIQIIADLPAE